MLGSPVFSAKPVGKTPDSHKLLLCDRVISYPKLAQFLKIVDEKSGRKLSDRNPESVTHRTESPPRACAKIWVFGDLQAEIHGFVSQV